MTERYFPEGTVTVRLHRRKRLNLVVDRRELEEALVVDMEGLRIENERLKKKLSDATRLLLNNGIPLPWQRRGDVVEEAVQE
jgi:hypothetical protein